MSPSQSQFPKATFKIRRNGHNSRIAAMSTNPVLAPGNSAVITGGASGIGLALAAKCATYGMRVIIVDNHPSNLASAKSSLKGNVDTVEMDVSKLDDFEKLRSKLMIDFGGAVPSFFLFVNPPCNIRGIQLLHSLNTSRGSHQF
jgi:threonine dehydrogenase-like Zn-dependent dehydrogenase